MNLEKIILIFVSPRANGFPTLVALIGAMSIYLGFSLFQSGIQDGGASLKVWSTAQGFEMGQGGPGLIFSAFGMGIIIFSIWRFSTLRASVESKPYHLDHLEEDERQALSERNVP